MLFYRVLAGILIWLKTANAVLKLEDTNFDSWLEDIDTALIMFHAPWCDVKSLGARANDVSSSCHGMKAEFDKAGVTLITKWPPVFLAKVDCIEGGKEICERFNIKKYPAVKIFRNGEESAVYNGPTDASGIVRHMLAYTGNQEADREEL